MTVGVVFLNNKFITESQAEANILTEGFLGGYGLFETMRACRENIVYLNQHLDRISKASRLIGLSIPGKEKLKSYVVATVRKNGLADAYVKLVCLKSAAGVDIIVVVKEYDKYPPKKYRAGFSGCISKIKQDERSWLSGIKSTSRISYSLAWKEAREKGCDEAILLNSRGFIAEGSRSNLFLVKNNQIYTPDAASGCLCGITRRAIIDIAKKRKINLYETSLTVNDCFRADEAFLTNSLMGVMPFSVLENMRIGRTSAGKVTRLLMSEYGALV